MFGIPQKLDSLKAKQQALNGRIDSLQRKLAFRLDSLKSFNIQDTILTKRYTALQAQLDSREAKCADERSLACRYGLANFYTNIR